MAARKPRQRNAEVVRALEAEKAEAVARLTTEFGLSPTDVVRFKKNGGEGRTYSEANPSHVNGDGSIAIYVDGWRSIPPEALERRTKGPRGGTVWEQVTRFG